MLCRLLSTVVLAVTVQTVLAQAVVINTTGDSSDSSAVLDVQSTTKGILIPRMNSIQRTMMVNPAEVLLVFDYKELEV